MHYLALILHLDIINKTHTS